MSRKRINDGLNKWQRFRLKDLPGFREKKREYIKTPEQREHRADYMRVWREKNREKHNRLSRESHQRNKHKHIGKAANRELLAKYGMSLLQKQEMVSKQNGRCLICDQEFKGTRSTHVDHCHKTGRIRGILCHACNTKLGWFETYENQVKAYLMKATKENLL